MQTVTDQQVDADFVQSEAPDVVMVAAGGQRESRLSESQSVNVVGVDSFNVDDIKDNVVIVGGNLQAVDIASFLLAQGKKVTIVNPGGKGTLDSGQSAWVRKFTLPHLYAKGVKVYNEADALEVTETGLKIAMRDCGLETEIACGTCVECWDMVPNTALVDELVQAGLDARAVGCDAPKNIQSAIHAGNVAARNV